MKETIRFVCIIALLSAMMVMPAAATTWYVHDGESIQAAISGASSGDTVFVYNGTYDIFFLDPKPNLTLSGESADVVTLDGGFDKSISTLPNSDGSVVEGFKVINSRCGIHVALDAPNCTFRNNIIDGTNYECGILIQSPNTTFENNVVLNATGCYGAMDISSEYNIIVNNTFKGATVAGITLDYDDGNNIVARNNIISNGYCGIEMFGAGEGNKIYLNNIVDNGVTVTTSGEAAPIVTYWNSTEPIAYTYGGSNYENYLGNYWGSDYTGIDADGDGIGDTPYPIPEISGDYDYHPLMEPFENYPEPAPAAADLTPTAITPNCGYLFGNGSNEICALIENNGGPASAFNVSFDINGDIQKVAVTGLAEGENITVCVTDTTIRSAGDPVTITVTADCNAEVAEDNETNNVLSGSETVVNNGYKGKRYTGGEDITTKMTYDLNGDLVYSAGDSYYASGSGGWTNIDVAWTASDLPVPGTSTIKEARLYVPYTYAKDGAMPDNYGMTFNGNPETYDVHYWDTKLYDRTYPYYGMLTYDVTANFSTSGNTANFSSLWSGLPSHSGASMRGVMLVVVYEDATEPRRQIFINEEFDMLGSSKCTTPDKATAWAPITDHSINPAMIASARLITFAPGADGTGTAGEGELIFNGQVWNDEWTDNEVHQIGISDRDVTAYLESTGNEVGFQSNADWMEASNAILIVEENIFSNNVYLEPADSGVSYGETTTVEVYANTVDLTQGGQFYLAYPSGCANITDITFDSMWDDKTTKDLTTFTGAAFATFTKYLPMVSGTQHICTLTIECDNPEYCQGDLHFEFEGEVPTGKGSKLFDDNGTVLTDIGWHDGTFTCMNLPDLVITEVYGEQQGTGNDYVVHYTVTNEGNANATGHTTTLYIGDTGGPHAWVEDQDLLDVLAPGESYTGTFSEVLTMTDPNDEMKVCADTGSDVMELDETNNCKTSIHPAGIEISVNVLDDGECVDYQEQFTVNIDVDTRNIPVCGIEYVLSFDNTVLHAEWQNEGTFLDSDGAETTMYINTIDNGAGTISFAATRVGGVGGVITSGTLAVIKFTASQQGGSSDLILSGVVAANMYGNEIDPLDLIDDSVCVSSSQSPVAIGKSMHKYTNDGQTYICKVYFNGTESYDPDGSLVNWRWSFGDGNYGTGESVDHIYQTWDWNTTTDEYDPFTVSLTVTDDGEPHQLDNTAEFDVIVYTAGDANGDGKVNILDATTVGLEWGQTTTCGAYCWEGQDRADKADLNNDCKVNILDAVIIGTCWGHTAW